MAQLNDAFRRRPSTGTVVCTDGVFALGQKALPLIVKLVQAFDAFTPDNDPHGEHDFGALSFGGERLFWKIDYFDREMRFASADPLDPSVTMRLLTIMLASEY
ncbi:DUF3768 domain-containing protein [Sphingomonas sp. BK235]|uniref:DUF3768 domain-containing protein n=1 Tax=Sphingomonas sp. BK235 TaxID=2512131 RepID=UPI0010455EE9|nr:DUF3768 domain-containing protein [Sphingomonas sp. BK235]TCP36086.1 uncharacterized protein DUF3768 [Sphingomonas sp. BK235]